MSESPEHTVKSYALELNRLREMVTTMGGMVERQLALSAAAVVQQNESAAAQAIELDPAVDAMEREIEKTIVSMIALRQPVADDLRHVIGTLKAVGDFERIGDYAANVAKRSLVLKQFALPFSLSGLGQMVRMVQENLKLVIDAVGEADAVKAEQVWRSDNQIDNLYDTLFRELVTYMMEDARAITPCTHLLFIAKNLERIGDHATNIAENILYAVTGLSLPEPRPKGGNRSYEPNGAGA